MFDPSTFLPTLTVGPLVVELQRNYHFTAVLLKTTWTAPASLKNLSINGAAVTTGKSGFRYLDPVLINAALIYASTLIKKIEQPQYSLDVDAVKIGPLEIPVPKAIKLEQFSIDFVEEVTGVVEYIYRAFFLELTGGGSLTFPEMYPIGMQLYFSRNMSDFLLDADYGNANQASTLLAEVPISVSHYPCVIPIGYELLEDWDKAGETYQTSKITFIRFPTLSDLTYKTGLTTSDSEPNPGSTSTAPPAQQPTTAKAITPAPATQPTPPSTPPSAPSPPTPPPSTPSAKKLD